MGAAMMGCILFCEHSESLGTVGGAVGWALKLAMLGDGDGLGMTTYNRESGLDITQTEVRICGVNEGINCCLNQAWKPSPTLAGIAV